MQGLPSSQTTGTACWQAPALQVSPVVHALSSSQDAVLLVLWQPALGSQLSVVQGLPSSHNVAAPPKHPPPLQESPVVQLLSSLQLPAVGAKRQPAAASQLSAVHGLPSSQPTEAPPVQVPPAQASPAVQALPSSQAAVLLVLLQPACGSQTSVVQGLLSSQLTAVVPVHRPTAQVSPEVHASPSSQAVVLSVAVQPTAGSQASVVHGLLSSHTTWVTPPHKPRAQVSPVVQALPSSQGPLVATLLQPLRGSQLSAVHGLPSAHRAALPPVQEPSAQASPLVQLSPSSQGAAIGAKTQPPAGLQVSLVQGLLSLQATAWPLHTPATHVSPAVQASPSVQGPANWLY